MKPLDTTLLRKPDVMLDLETWGTKPGSALRSIGAVVFDLYGGTGATFYRNITDQSCAFANLDFDPDTRVWWSKQSKEAQVAFDDPTPVSLEFAVMQFFDWFKAQKCERVWGNGGSFDPVLWECACRAVGQRIPWRHTGIRDLRTLVDLADIDPKAIPFEGTPHNALDDCYHQVKIVAHAWDRLSRPHNLSHLSRG